MSHWNWVNASGVTRAEYTCGHCGKDIGPSLGYVANHRAISANRHIYICPTCERPTFKEGDNQVPAPLMGRRVGGIKDANIAELYEEARKCTSLCAYTCAAMACRKLLMNIAVAEGAALNMNFYQYVEFLVTEGIVPKKSKGWVTLIKDKGNEANHEIRAVTKRDAEQLLEFTAMLLQITYEFEEKLSAKT